MEHNRRRLGTVVTTLNILNFFFAARIFMHLVSPTLKNVQCPANSSGLSDLDTKILIEVLNLLWLD